MNSALKTLILPFVAASMTWLACPAFADSFLVENGQPVEYGQKLFKVKNA